MVLILFQVQIVVNFDFSLKLATFFFSCCNIWLSDGLKGKFKMVQKFFLLCLEVSFAMLGLLLMPFQA